MSEEKDIIEHETELLQALAAQAPAEDFSVSRGEPLADETPLSSKDELIEALRTVCDPEIMINIYDLGLVYDIRQNLDGNVEVDMTLTAPTCPVAGILPEQAAEALSSLSGVGVAKVNVVWEPAWTPDRLSDEAKAMLEMF
uniref:SUF system Fe-S cluster assembly protein n=1 Tax=uncultured Alphaproteobacteria bacterium TaxID=91750 RepID=A0A6G8F2X3_9PROT|nr:SUF system Fe-S cluster assembly protein [uncultured Alphaproteobacteria bacterium]